MGGRKEESTSRDWDGAINLQSLLSNHSLLNKRLDAIQDALEAERKVIQGMVQQVVALKSLAWMVTVNRYRKHVSDLAFFRRYREQ